MSLTSVVCKLLEALIRDHIVESKVMSNQSVMFLEEITKSVDDGSPVDVFYLDFQKAFYKVPHQRLLLKLKAHCISNDVINSIEVWLIYI